MTNQPITTILFGLAFVWIIAILWILVDAYRRQSQQIGKAKGHPTSAGEFFLTTVVSLLRYGIIRCSVCLISGMVLLMPVVSGSPAFSAMQRLFLYVTGILLTVVGMFGFGMMLVVSQQRKPASFTEESEEKNG